jgi:hypothetical protein
MDFYLKEVNFYIPSKRIFHTTACIAQGFIELGFKVRSNVPFSFENIDSRGISTPFSLMTAPHFYEINESTDGLFIIDVTHGFGEHEQLIKYLSKKNVFLINMADSANFQDFPVELKVATAHYNKFAIREGNFYPMPFGLSADIIKLASSFNVIDKRRPKVIHNFKPSLSQGVRNFLAVSLEQRLDSSNLMSYEYLAGQDYAESLARTMFICVYGGDIYRDLNRASLYGDNSFESNRMYKFKQLTEEYVVLRWDSWRFYEAMIFGCLPIQLNFEVYGMKVNVPIPVNDYISVSFNNLDSTVQKIIEVKDSVTKLNQASNDIKTWATLNVSPRALAVYSLEILETMPVTSSI